MKNISKTILENLDDNIIKSEKILKESNIEKSILYSIVNDIKRKYNTDKESTFEDDLKPSCYHSKMLVNDDNNHIYSLSITIQHAGQGKLRENTKEFVTKEE